MDSHNHKRPDIALLGARDGKYYGQALAELSGVRVAMKADKIISNPAINAGKTERLKAIIIPFPLIIPNG